MGFNIISAETEILDSGDTDFWSLSVAVGDMNTFLNSWADYLETETLPMTKFNTGTKLAFFLLFFPFFPL